MQVFHGYRNPHDKDEGRELQTLLELLYISDD
jgi:hypothetical protein